MWNKRGNVLPWMRFKYWSWFQPTSQSSRGKPTRSEEEVEEGFRRVVPHAIPLTFKCSGIVTAMEIRGLGPRGIGDHEQMGNNVD